jgi:hypothetical protein
MTIAASVVVVLMAFQRIADLYSLDTREAIAKFVADQPTGGLGLTVDEVVTALRVLTMVAAGCAAAAVVLAVFVLRRHAAARLALTVLAGPLFVAGLATGAIASSVAAAAALSLWFEPSRSWLSGRPAAGATRTPPQAPPRTPPPPPFGQPDPQDRRDRSGPPAPRGPHGPHGPHGPSTPTGYGQYPTPYQGAYGAPTPATAPTIPRPPVAGWAREEQARPPRPRAVTLACVLTWVASGLTALLMVATAVLLSADPDYVLQRAHEQNPQLRAEGVTDDVLIAVTLVMLGAVVLWCLATVVLGVLVLRGTEWARVLLVISAATSAALSLVATALGAFLLLLTLAASAATLVLLVRPDVRPFFRRRRP